MKRRAATYLLDKAAQLGTNDEIDVALLGASGPPDDKEPGTQATTVPRLHKERWDLWSLVALLVITMVGAFIRAGRFANTGLFRDDAWVALSSRVGLGTAWHMWVTAPGFGLAERTWILLGPSATWWYQLLPFLCGVAAVPAIFVLARYFRLGRLAALALALVVCASPICARYSTSVKEYPFDFLLSCLLLALAEAARREPKSGALVAFAAASVGAFVVSASVGVVVIGLWIALAIATLSDRSGRSRVLLIAAGTAAACGFVGAIFYRHLSPTLDTLWKRNFIEFSSVHNFATSSTYVVKNLVVPNLVAVPAASRVFWPLLVILWALLSLVAVRRDPSMLGSALAVAFAFALCAMQLVPLGTGRTDEYLYPPLLLLVGAGASRFLAPIDGAFRERSSASARFAVMAALLFLSMSVAGALLRHAANATSTYPGVNVRALATAVQRGEHPGDHVFVSEVTRYPWAFYEDTPLDIEFGTEWSTGFTALSTDPKVFIAPSEDYEEGARLQQWVNDMARYRRIWYVWTQPLDENNKSYAVFLHQGWHPVQTLGASGGGATLLVRDTNGSAG